MVFLPRKQFPDKPAMVVELKWDQDAKGAIAQIKEKEYCASLTDYKGKILLVGISYEKKTRKHSCIIEELEAHGHEKDRQYRKINRAYQGGNFAISYSGGNRKRTSGIGI